MAADPPSLEERRRLQAELSEFVESCWRTLDEVTASLGWSLEQLDATEDEIVICPYDSNHRMPKSSLAKHVESCRLRKLGYTKEEQEEMYNPDFFYENVKVPSITLRIYSSSPVEVPLNHKRSVCDLTQADRLALYDFVVEETKKQRSSSQTIENDSDLFVDLAAKVNQDNSRKSPKSYLEILAEVRDYKRRRQSYRAKNVHITKKSYTEVIRDVISVHMEELSHHWKEEQAKAEGGAARKEEPRSASADSRQSAGSYFDAEGSRRRGRSRSPHKRKRNKEKDKSSESRRRKERQLGQRENFSSIGLVLRFLQQSELSQDEARAQASVGWAILCCFSR
ncbi:U11/U12 small nuclear ribonucleoprotein 48 kDa protein isoform X2 [Ochotona princeps]|uniref:U11/U12 small nuclear ribonucleoprotein 48 kDa protein isoform X2 n=1 Tax=Ochotona princeps TaxID=9978 RepID=UPI002715482F|nr:U11/U12 small nuclear ribonucleoprotein 48 kDa protein isoform X2 [Ochotona princeps]